ncbi:tapasin isoform X2 [Gasterosteus aculeatus]
MSPILQILAYVCLCAGVQSVHQVSWLPCLFTDEHVFLDPDGHMRTEHVPRDAVLQFGQTGDPPANPHAVTFLVTGSKLDLRRFLEGAEAEQLECELRRYSTKGVHDIRWPVQGSAGQEHNRWFSCTLAHAKGLFKVTGFLRHPSDRPPPDHQEYHSWPAIRDGETLVTSVAMVIKTRSPSVRAALGSGQKLHCHFSADHKGPNVTVEWHRRRRGEVTRLFSHAARSGVAEGSGVALRALASGDASYDLPFAEVKSEATYICSVSVPPLLGALEIDLRIEEAPRVSLNIGPALSLPEGGEQKVSCHAENYYPLDVEIVWYVQDAAAAAAASGRRVGAPLPKELQNVLLSSHRHNQDQTYSLTSFFYLQAWPEASGRLFTCSVSHPALRMPVKKSFVLTVEERSDWMLKLLGGLVLVSLVAVLFLLLGHLHSAKRRSVQKKPY